MAKGTPDTTDHAALLETIRRLEAENASLHREVDSFAAVRDQYVAARDQHAAARDQAERQRDRVVQERDRLVVERDTALEEAERVRGELRQLQEQLDRIRHRLYGPKSEKLDPRQLLLFAQQGEGAADSTTSEEAPTELAADDESAEELLEELPPAGKKKKGKGGAGRPARTIQYGDRVRTEVVDHPVEDAHCKGCGGEMVSIGVDQSTELEYVPAHFLRRIHRRQKMACRKCAEWVERAPAPPRVLDKCLPGVVLAVWLLVFKYQDHQPLYRLRRIFQRLGVDIPRSTLCDWVLKLADVLEPIVDAMRQEIVSQKYLQTDDTRVVALIERGNTKQKVNACLWPYLAGEQVVFDFTLSRSRDGPERVLRNFQGILHTDGFAGYHGLQARDGIVGAGCFAHTRRKFKEALDAKAPLAQVLPAIACIRQLYEVEKEAREGKLGAEARQRLRREKSRSVVAAFFREIRRLDRDPSVLPRSALGKAVGYALSQRKRLTVFLDHGQVEIDTNAVERTIRPIALGRRNWLFAGSERGGRAAAIVYSLLETCQIQAIPVDTYLLDVLTMLQSTAAIDPRDLTPKAWKQTRAHLAAPMPEVPLSPEAAAQASA